MKRAKLVLAAALAMSLTVGAAVPALAFYQQPQICSPTSETSV